MERRNVNMNAKEAANEKLEGDTRLEINQSPT